MNRLHQKFIQHAPAQPTVVAISGGLDSVVLLHLYVMAQIKVVAAHCNFQLRAEESDTDALFVEKLCEKWKIPFEKAVFDTANQAQDRRLSIQETARELRYAFFETVRLKHGCAYIATAHHAADNAETILMNMVRGTGIRGLMGIPPQNGLVIRPILSFTKLEIEEIAKSALLLWREDSSNETDKYRRNYIRHNVMPLLLHLNPNLENNLSEQSEHLRDVYGMFKNDVEMARLRYTDFQDENGIYTIYLTEIKYHPQPNTLLYELLYDYGFNATQVAEILRVSENGKQFFSKTHHAVVHQDKLLVYSDNFDTNQYFIEYITDSLTVSNASFQIEHLAIGDVKIDRTDRSNLTAYLDITHLDFPLVLRHWQSGDAIQPLGMEGRTKKVSDLFINAKMSLADKQWAWLLTDTNNKTAWVVGVRMSEAFKITSDTKTVLKITCTPKPQQSSN
jgi:tRNA(Ile)-lysidine synthase